MSKASDMAARLRTPEVIITDGSCLSPLAEVAANFILDQAILLHEASETIHELIGDVEIAVRSEYGWPDVHPIMKRKFERDMASVNDAKIVLERIRKAIA